MGSRTRNVRSAVAAIRPRAARDAHAGPSLANRGRSEDLKAATRWIALVIVMLFAVEGLALLVNLAWLQ